MNDSKKYYNDESKEYSSMDYDKCNYCNKHNIKNNDCDYLLSKYIHEIRNMKTLNKNMINNIYNMSDSCKMEIIKNFNDVVESLKTIIDNFD